MYYWYTGEKTCVVSAQMLEVSLSGVGAVPRLETDAWYNGQKVYLRHATKKIRALQRLQGTANYFPL